MDLEGRVDPEYLPMVATMTATDSFAADLPAARKSQTEAMAKLSQASTSPDITIFERNITAPEGHEFMVPTPGRKVFCR